MPREVTFVDEQALRDWYKSDPQPSRVVRGIGGESIDASYLEQTLGLPLHLRFIAERQLHDQASDGQQTLASIPFYSLCRGLFLPLSGISAAKAAHLFGIQVDEPPNFSAREALLANFFEKPVGLSLVQKLSCILGDPFRGKPSTVRRDSLLRLLLSIKLASRRQLLDRLTVVGEIPALFAEAEPRLRVDPPLTAAEVLVALLYMPAERRLFKFDLLRSLLARCSKLEAYFLARLVLRKAGLGFEYQGPLIARQLASHFGVDEDAVAHAMALTDAFAVADLLAIEGADGLRKIQLQPLSPVRPALATTADVKSYPVWVERKYDGIRLMLHKSTGARGSVLCGAYTRNRGDWLEMIPGMNATIGMLPCQSAIIDGEIYGTRATLEGLRPASVYHVYGALQGDQLSQINLRYAAFDLLYLNGQDLTQLPLHARRQRLAALFAPLSGVLESLPVPLRLTDGQMAQDKADLNRLYQHFRAQGYEGLISKDLERPYALATRDPSWTKRKPEVTVDLALLGAVFAVTTKENAGLFGSYVVGALGADGAFVDVGDVAGVDRVRDAEIQQEIMREGLITGRRIERQSASGTRPGLELRPQIVVTVKFEGLARDFSSERISLRDPKLAMIRSDKSPLETTTVKDLEALLLRQNVG
ncbi:MAG: hypothetical protein H6707_06860 [Deltaproteobacteria bacterium]|nr:hypothetical protein [Deltaproteobacteria bacterium]